MARPWHGSATVFVLCCAAVTCAPAEPIPAPPPTVAVRPPPAGRALPDVCRRLAHPGLRWRRNATDALQLAALGRFDSTSVAARAVIAVRFGYNMPERERQGYAVAVGGVLFGEELGEHRLCVPATLDLQGVIWAADRLRHNPGVVYAVPIYVDSWIGPAA